MRANFLFGWIEAAQKLEKRVLLKKYRATIGCAGWARGKKKSVDSGQSSGRLEGDGLADFGA